MSLTRPEQFYEGQQAHENGLAKTDNPYNKSGMGSLGGAAWWVTGWNDANKSTKAPTSS